MRPRVGGFRAVGLSLRLRVMAGINRTASEVQV